MRTRRQFITLLGAAAAWLLGARAQQGERVRRIGVLMSAAAADMERQACIAAFHRAGSDSIGKIIIGRFRTFATNKIQDLQFGA